MTSNLKFVHVSYFSRFSELSAALKVLKPEQIIAVTEKLGYTVVWQSESRLDKL